MTTKIQKESVENYQFENLWFLRFAEMDSNQDYVLFLKKLGIDDDLLKIFSDEQMSAGHYYEVELNENTSNPTILEVIREIENLKDDESETVDIS